MNIMQLCRPDPKRATREKRVQFGKSDPPRSDPVCSAIRSHGKAVLGKTLLSPVITIVCIFLFGWLPTVWAQVNKCVLKDGGTIYTDQPCPSGAEVKTRRNDTGGKEARSFTFPELSWDGQLFAYRCVERWETDASPVARTAMAAKVDLDFKTATEAQLRHFEKQANGRSFEEMKRLIIEKETQLFIADCEGNGFKPMGAQDSDLDNQRLSVALRRHLRDKYPQVRERYEKAIGK